MNHLIYIIDDDPSIRQGVGYGLGKLYDIKSFLNAEIALKTVGTDAPDLVLLDIGLPGMSGLEALKQIKQLYPQVLVIMFTAYDQIDTVVTAMKDGAYDYILKPLHMDTLRTSVKNALETVKMRKEIQMLQEAFFNENLPCFIAESKSIQDVMGFVEKVAVSPDTPVMILGETGTGKELIAGAIHYKSPNYRGPFICINCAAIPKEIIESELFGYEKGAFSGANPAGKTGLVEQAAGGTLFLDEVGDLSLPAQAKLLRFIEEGEFYRVGGTRKHKISARIVSATNKDMDELIREGQFREDLFYRLAVIKIEVPSLNERREDIIPIAEHFLMEYNSKFRKTFSSISSEAKAFLMNYQWKGNIRELRNMIERGVLTGDGNTLRLSDIALDGSSPPAPEHQDSPGSDIFPPLPEEGIDLAALEEHYIREAYNRSGGNEVKAARLLNTTYYSFRYKRKKVYKQAGE